MEKLNENTVNSNSPWGPRVPVEIDKDSGLMIAGAAKRPIDLNQDVSLALSSYLSMVYELRSMTSGVVSLRVEDISSLANAFEMEETEIGERLARMMHCDDLQTRRFLQMLKRGRVLVPISMVAAGALIAVTLSFNGAGPKPSSIAPQGQRANVEIVAPTNEVRTEAVVDIGDAALVERGVASDAQVDTYNNEDLNPTPDFAGPETTTPETSEPEVKGQSVTTDIQIGEGISVTRNDGQGE